MSDAGNTQTNLITVNLNNPDVTNTIVHELGHTVINEEDNGGPMDYQNAEYYKGGAVIPETVKHISAIGNEMQDVRDADGGTNLMYNNGSDPILLKSQLDVIDSNIPADKSGVVPFASPQK